MSALDQQIQTVGDKLQQLVKKQQLIQKENQRLQKENQKLQQQLETMHGQVNNLQEKIGAIKLNPANMDDSVKKDLEKRITIYLKEIDKCLALLNA